MSIISVSPVKALPACSKLILARFALRRALAIPLKVVTVDQGLPFTVIVKANYRQPEAIGTHQSELALFSGKEDTLKHWSIVILCGKGQYPIKCFR